MSGVRGAGARHPRPFGATACRVVCVAMRRLRPRRDDPPAHGVPQPGQRLNMKINGKAYRTIWLAPDQWSVEIIDQTRLPHELVVIPLKSAEDAARAILTMQVRGAPLIGATAAYGLAMAIREDASDEAIERAVEFLAKQRPTAINLRWALEEMRRAVQSLPRGERLAAAYKL